MINPPRGLHSCPTRADGAPGLFQHSITPELCRERQGAHYHKCYACVHNQDVALEEVAPLPPAERAYPPSPLPEEVPEPAREVAEALEAAEVQEAVEVQEAAELVKEELAASEVDTVILEPQPPPDREKEVAADSESPEAATRRAKVG